MVQVTISDGILEGEVVDNVYSGGGRYYSFKGIPYAAPPVGDLRFKAPQPPKPWTGVRKATEFGPICLQFEFISFDIPDNASEDCLYLNVYSPEITPKKPLPVIVWIHGGGFKSGSGNDDLYGPQLLIREDVVLVTFNYRLEIFGFLCLDSEEIPGNAGMKDQVAALRWVKRNISNFGGDPDNVTIFGESAGGVSVGFQLISPMSKGLFKRAIQASGNCITDWGSPPRPREHALALAQKLGCYSEDDKELYEFFKKQPANKLIQHFVPLTFLEASSKLRVFYAVVDEKQFGDNERFWFGDTVDTLRNKGIHEGVEVLTGFTQDEGYFCLVSNIDKQIKDANNYLEYFVPDHLVYKASVDQQLKIGEKIKKQYFGKGPITRDHVPALCNVWGMDAFKLPLVQFAKAVSRRNKLYFYNFNYFSERNCMISIMKAKSVVEDRKVVCHADDLGYLFHGSLVGKADETKESFQVINMMTKMWTNFVKYGNPTPDNSLGSIWSPFTPQGQEYMEISSQLTRAQHPARGDVRFFEGIFKQYYPEYIQ